MKRKGFTLVELLIVIAVLGALTAMVQLSGTNAAASAKAASIASGLRTIKTAARMYIAENAASALSFDVFSNDLNSYVEDNSDFGVQKTDEGVWQAYYTFADSDTDGTKGKFGSAPYEDITVADDKKTAMMNIYTPPSED